jgi:hypothetical protein
MTKERNLAPDLSYQIKKAPEFGGFVIMAIFLV